MAAPGMATTVLHVTLRGFRTAVARRLERMKGPVLVVDGDQVADACPLARQKGALPGMPLWQAVKVCPDAAAVPDDGGRWAPYRERFYEACLGLSPYVEPYEHQGAPGFDPAAYLALGTGRDPRATATGLAGTLVPRLGDALVIGAGANRFVARTAARVIAPAPDRTGEPLSVARVPPGGEAAFLAPLPIGVLADDFSPGLLTALARLGCRTLGDLQRLPRSAMERTFGAAEGGRLAGMSRGNDTASVAAAFPPAGVTVRLALEPAADLDGMALADILRRLAGDAAGRLRSRQRRAGRLTLEMETAAGAIFRAERHLARPALSASALATVLNALAARLPPAALSQVAAAALLARSLTPIPWEQPSLWGNARPAPGTAFDTAPGTAHLDSLVAAIQRKHGAKSLRRSAPHTPADTWRERRLALWDPWRWSSSPVS